MTAALSRTVGSSQRAPGSACNRTSKEAYKKRQQLQQRRNTYPTQTTANFTTRKRASKLPVPSNSLSSSSRSRRSLPSRLDSYDIAPTDPDYITWLWRDVMGSKRGTGGVGRAGSFIPLRPARGPKGITTAETPLPAPSEVETLASQQTGQIGQTSKGIQITDRNFEQLVLVPYGITLSKESYRISHQFSFPKEVPLDRAARLSFYKEKLPLGIWLDANNNERIEQRYCMMERDGRCEADFQAYALGTIFHDHDAVLFNRMSSAVRFVPERMVELVHSADKTTVWQSPPLGQSEKIYGWDIRPDCSYYVSIQAFPADQRVDCHELVSLVYKERAFGSYFTIEFKKNSMSIDVAERQIAIASTLSLYNRWRLKLSKVELQDKNNWSKEDKDHLRHYCLTFTGPRWTIWCVNPKTYEEWTGCTVTSLKNGNCTHIDHVTTLFEYVNDIHYWGLMVHGKSIVNDWLSVSSKGRDRRLVQHDGEWVVEDGDATEESGRSDDAAQTQKTLVIR
ncbi:hypothetical protein F4679DRAFT_527574 [Xylaria curta]|nr:hypothetical protein F4679DRAFT_527574 [Xylaria curta]